MRGSYKTPERDTSVLVTRLYIMPAGDDWIHHFEETVATPSDLQRTDDIRIWGTTEGVRKRTFFEDMEAGDPVLFYNDGQFFAAGRVGTTFESSDAGRELWRNEASRFIFTITDYEEITIPRERIADLLGYDSSWAPQGFMQISEAAVNSLLQEYNSIEEAFQAFQTSTTVETKNETDDVQLVDDDDESREHTEIQYLLVQLGLQHGYDVYVAKNDKTARMMANASAKTALKT